MDKRGILNKTASLCGEIGDLTNKLVQGLEALSNSNGGPPLLTQKEYFVLKNKFKKNKPQISFQRGFDINQEIGKNLKRIEEYSINATIMISLLLHEAESGFREYEYENQELKKQLGDLGKLKGDYEMEICLLTRELANYRGR